jgi:DNA repair protein RadA/Sms
MPKKSTVYICQNCGWSAPKWVGQCQSCQQWNTLVEEVVEKTAKGAGAKKATQWRDSAVVFSQVEAFSGAKQRFSTGIHELDRVLGGDLVGDDEVLSQGLVPGAVILIGGEPGVGKSTLLTQVVVQMLGEGDVGAKPDSRDATAGSRDANAASNHQVKPILYVAGEESPSQIALRINRILGNEQSLAKKKSPSSTGKTSASNLLADNLQFFTSTDADDIVAAIKELQPQLVVVDSIQTITTQDLSGAAGSVGQIRESTERLTQAAKQHQVPMFLVGHVTKEGVISGPKVLEHIVDAVLELSGERTNDLRILRALKNRFGATDEVGVFRVREFGYESVDNPSELFLEESQSGVPGSATVCVMEGTRPLLIEIQSLVVSSQLSMPRRVGRGIELSRIQVLSAVLQKHVGLPLGSADIFVSAAGGFQVKEPAVDLGLAVAIASSLKNKPLPPKTVLIGEVGLLGEIRSVNLLERRIKEAKRLGFEHIISRDTHRSLSHVLKALKI